MIRISLKATPQYYILGVKLGVLFAERQGTEPIHLTAYKSVIYFPIFQIGNETVTILYRFCVQLCLLNVYLSHGFKDTTHF